MVALHSGLTPFQRECLKAIAQSEHGLLTAIEISEAVKGNRKSHLAVKNALSKLARSLMDGNQTGKCPFIGKLPAKDRWDVSRWFLTPEGYTLLGYQLIKGAWSASEELRPSKAESS